MTSLLFLVAESEKKQATDRTDFTDVYFVVITSGAAARDLHSQTTNDDRLTTNETLTLLDSRLR